MAGGKRLILQLLVVCLAAPAVRSAWLEGTATFYGGKDGSGTMGGACGYSNLYDQGYGMMNAALSTALFNDGNSCGQCYLILCDRSKSDMCTPGNKAITITATNLCPADYTKPSNNGGWCNPPRAHFDISQPAWLNIGIYQAGIIPVVYNQVRCWKDGGVRFTMLGFNYFELVLLTNVGGSGSIKSIAVKASSTGWIQMSRNWGVIWQGMSGLSGKALSFRITSSGGHTIEFPYVIPDGWLFGQTFSNWRQFEY